MDGIVDIDQARAAGQAFDCRESRHQFFLEENDIAVPARGNLRKPLGKSGGKPWRPQRPYARWIGAQAWPSFVDIDPQSGKGLNVLPDAETRGRDIPAARIGRDA